MIVAGAQGNVTASSLRNVVQGGFGSRSFGSFAAEAFSGRSVTREGALGIAAWYACVSLLAEVGGTLPLRVRDRARQNELVGGADVAIRIGHTPNPETPATVFWSTVIGHLAGCGNSFYLKLPASDGLVNAPEMWLLSPEHVTKYRDADGQVRFDVVGEENGLQLRGVHSRHIGHIRGWSFGNGFMGLTKIGVLRHQLGVDLAAQEYQGRTFRNGATPKGVLSVDEALQEDQAKTIRDQWHATYGGMENAGKIAVLDRGAKFQDISMNSKDLQFIEQRKLGATEIAGIHHIMPAMIGAEGPSFQYSNATQNDRHLTRYGLGPILKFVVSALNVDTDLFGPRSPWEPFFDTDDLVTPDMETFWRVVGQAVKDGILDGEEARTKLGMALRPAETPSGQPFGYDLDGGIVTINERRAALGLPPRPDGDATVPSYLKTLEPQE